MKENNKIPLTLLRDELHRQVHCEDPEKAIQTALYGWIRHPGYESPARTTMNVRIRKDGYAWLKPDEVPSFEDYVGLKMRK